MSMRDQYENSQVELGPWLSRYPLPDAPGVITVTHDMAGDWLDYRSRPGTEHQRKLSRTKVEGYARLMDAGLWRLTPQGLLFDTDGWMFNGQHRLQALRNSSLDALDFWVFPEEAADLFSVVDTGYGRQAHQLYRGRYGTAVTAAVRYLGPVPGQYVRSMPPVQTLAEVEKWPELVTHAAAASAAMQKAKIPASPHLAVLAQAERTEYRHRIPSWVEGLVSGAGLQAGDPRLLLRERFLSLTRQQRTTDYNYSTIAKAWNAYAVGVPLQTLAWRVTEGILSVIGTGADLSAGLDLDAEE